MTLIFIFNSANFSKKKEVENFKREEAMLFSDIFRKERKWNIKEINVMWNKKVRHSSKLSFSSG
jgi:hypothetical protein